MTSRRGFLLGLGAALAAPAVVRAESIMRVAKLRQQVFNDASVRGVVMGELLVCDMATGRWAPANFADHKRDIAGVALETVSPGQLVRIHAFGQHGIDTELLVYV